MNGSYKGTDTDIGKLIHDFLCTRAEDMYNSVLADRCDYVKQLKGDDENMTKLIEALINEYAEIARKEAIVEGKAQGIAEGRAEGMAAGKAEAMQEAKKNQILAIRYLLKTTNSTPENLAAAFNIPIEEVNRIAREG